MESSPLIPHLIIQFTHSKCKGAMFSGKGKMQSAVTGMQVQQVAHHFSLN